MQVQQLFLSLAVSCAVLCTPTAPKKDLATFGTWRTTGVTQTRAVADGGEDTAWLTDGRCGSWESEVNRPAPTRVAHRALFVWALPGTTVAGDAAALSASVVVLEANGLAGDCHVEIFAWQGAADHVPADAVRLVSAYVPAGAPEGTVERVDAGWRMPAPSTADAALQVRCVVTHRGNTLTCTHSYGWSPAPPL